MANNIKLIDELSEVFNCLSKAYYEKKGIKKDYLIQEAELKILEIKNGLLLDEVRNADNRLKELDA